MILVRQLWKIGAALLLGGCISTNFSPSTSKQVIDPATDGNYTVTGFAASRHWSSRLFYGIPLGPDRPYNAINEMEYNQGAKAVAQPRVHVENYTINPGAYVMHYGGFIPFILGTEGAYTDAVLIEPNYQPAK